MASTALVHSRTAPASPGNSACGNTAPNFMVWSQDFPHFLEPAQVLLGALEAVAHCVHGEMARAEVLPRLSEVGPLVLIRANPIDAAFNADLGRVAAGLAGVFVDAVFQGEAGVVRLTNR